MRMRLVVRRVGNSLGVIIPRTTLRTWGVAEGDALELSSHSIRPPAPSRPQALDGTACGCCRGAMHGARDPRHVASSLGERRSAYDEWKRILEHEGDGELFVAMLGRDERANRLRQSPPYVGLLSREQVRALNEEASA
jgi:hypothetical protein